MNHYPSDITDAQWALIEPHIPPEPGGGRPRKTDVRDVLDAIFYILRTGCQWRYLPMDFPPKSTAWRYFDEWRHNGTLDTIHDTLRKKVRTQEKPYSPRTTASVDSQSVDTTSGGEQRGRDNAKNRHYSKVTVHPTPRSSLYRAGKVALVQQRRTNVGLLQGAKGDLS